MTVGMASSSGYWVGIRRSFLDAAVWYACFACAGMLLVSFAIILRNGLETFNQMLEMFLIISTLINFIFMAWSMLRRREQQKLSNALVNELLKGKASTDPDSVNAAMVRALRIID